MPARIFALLATVFALALAPASAEAARLVQLPGSAGCLLSTAVADCSVTPVGSPNGILAVGNQVYMSSTSDDTIRVYNRDTVTGALTYASCINDSGSGCVDGRGLVDPFRMVASPDGTKLYVGGLGSVVALTRNGDGSLTQSDVINSCITQTGSEGECATSPAIQNVQGIAISPDGADVYASGLGTSDGSQGFLTHLDVVSGGLAQHAPASGGCAENVPVNGCLDARSMASARVVAIPPDGKHLYVTSASSNAVTNFTRNADGSLALIGGTPGCVNTSGAEGCQTNALFDPGASASEVYGITFVSNAIGYTSSIWGAIVMLARDSSSGGLTAPGKCAASRNDASYGPCADVVDLFGTVDLHGFGNGTGLLSASRFGRGLHLFTLGADGTITPEPSPAGCIATGGNGPTTDCTIPRGFARVFGQQIGPNDATISPDGKFVYAASPQANEDRPAILAAEIDKANPVCQDATVDVTGGQQIALPLKCTDVDNDAITISTVTLPAKGITGTVDQGNQSANFAAPTDFAGDLTLTFKGVANGFESNVATVTIRVAAPPVVNPTPTPVPTVVPTVVPPGRILSPVRSSFTVFRNRYTVVKRMQIIDIPEGATVTILCSGKKCPFKKRTFKPSKGRVNALKALRKGRLRKGAKLEVRITAPGMIGKSVLYVMNGKTVPGGRTQCLPVGSTKRTKC